MTVPPTWPAVIYGAVLVGLAVLLVLTKDALAPYIIGLILVFLMNGAVDRLADAGAPRWLATVMSIMVLVLVIAIVIYVILAALLEQVASLAASVPGIAAAVRGWLIDLQLPSTVYEAVERWVSALPDAIPDVLPRILGVVLTGVAGFVAVFIAVAGLPFWIFYALSDSPAVMRGLRQSVPPPYRAATFDLVRILGEVFGAWARGLVLLALSVGIPFFAGFVVIGWLVDPDVGRYALLFSVTFGLAEFVPIVGPIIVLVPVLIIAVAVGGAEAGLAVGLLFIVIEQIEGAVLIPRIHGQHLRLHPVVILPALVIGTALAGLMGAILALPITAALRRIVAYLLWTTGGTDQHDAPATEAAASARDPQLADPSVLAHGG